MEDIQAAIARLANASLQDLRIEWRRYHRTDPPAAMPRDFLVRALAYALQERVHGQLNQTSKRALRGAVSTGAKKHGGKSKQPHPILSPGVRLVRAWGGKSHTVLVLENGFGYQDKRYRSLTQIAKAITGTHWSGPRFFGVTKQSGHIVLSTGDVSPTANSRYSRAQI